MIAIFSAITAAHFDFIPFWDAKAYLYCVEEAVQKPFNLLNFRCGGHPSIVYALLWAVTQYVWPWRPQLMYAINVIVGVASIIAFDSLLRLLFPGRGESEYTLTTALYALAPVFVAHAIFLNVDYGATAFFVVFIYFLFARRFWLASAAAVAVMFTKETGTAACAVVITAYVAAFVLRPGITWDEGLAMLRTHAPLVAPAIVLIGYGLTVVLLRPDPMGWLNAYAPTGVIADRTDAILNTNLADPGIRSFLVDVFILNYQWLYTAVIVAALCYVTIRVAPRPEGEREMLRRGVFLAVALCGLVYVVTRFRFSNAARYVLFASPILVLAFYHALTVLVANHVRRAFYLALCALVVTLSNFRTIDFVSRAIFGTFPFGSHALLNMPSLMGGLKLDCIVYNLEFLQLQYLFADMIRDVRPRPDSILLMGNAIWNFPPDVDGRTYELVANPSHAVPYFVAIGDIKRSALQSRVRSDGEVFYYVAFANADNVQLQGLLKDYPLVAMKRYERYGYTLDLYKFEFRFTEQGR